MVCDSRLLTLHILFDNRPQGRNGPHSTFRFEFNMDGDKRALPLIQLMFTEEPANGWSIRPSVEPCTIRKSHCDDIGQPRQPNPPSCEILVSASANAVARLDYPIQVEGVVEPITLVINRPL
uniref:Uncharacterized protein n=1 Tax=Amphimedon queenslandica TaxID=400682 RepID=A0A1X7T0S9_AMPQE